MRAVSGVVREEVTKDTIGNALSNTSSSRWSSGGGGGGPGHQKRSRSRKGKNLGRRCVCGGLWCLEDRLTNEKGARMPGLLGRDNNSKSVPNILQSKREENRDSRYSQTGMAAVFL